MTRELTHNGYTAILYGNSSMVILDKDGKELIHSGSCDHSITDGQIRKFIEFAVGLHNDKQKGENSK